MKKLLCIVLIVVVFHGFPFSDVSASVNLTLEECVSYALKNNDSMKASYSGAEMYKQAARMSLSEFFPKLSLDAHYTQRDKAQTFIVGKDSFASGIPPADTALPAEDKDTYSVTLRLKQPLFTGGNLVNSYSNAKILEQASRSDSDNVRNETVRVVKRAYYDVLKSLKTKEIQEQTLKQKQERLRVIEERQREGITTKEELLSAKVDTSTEELELMRTHNDLSIKKKKLKNLIGINPDTEISLADKLENTKLLLGLEESTNIALSNRKDLASLQYKTQGAEREIQISKSNFYPEASLEGSYTRQKETSFSTPELWAVMVKVEWDIFEWGRTTAEVKRARANHEKLTNEYNSLKREVMLDVEKKWFRVKESEQEVKVFEERLTHADEQYKNASLKYKEALIKTAELLEAETYLVQGRNNYYNSIYDLNIAMAEFENSISSDISQFTATEKITQPRTEIIQPDVRPEDAGKSAAPESPEETRGEKDNQDVEKVKTGEVALPEQIHGQENSLHGDATGRTESSEKNIRYALQVGAFKSESTAHMVAEKLKPFYPNISIVKVNNFNKVRVNGIRTKQEGTAILRDIETKFKLKPLLIISQAI